MRSPVSVTVSGVGISNWIVLDYLQRPFDVALMASLSEDAAGVTYTVEFTPDNPNQTKANTNPVVAYARAGTTATLTFAKPHDLSAGDSVRVFNSGDPNLDGNMQVVTAPSPTQVTFAVANTGATVGSVYSAGIPLRVFPHDYMAALSARADGNFAFPCWACRLNVGASTGGSVKLSVLQGHARG